MAQEDTQASLLHVNYSDRALLVFLLRSFIIRNTRAYDEMQNKAVIPVYWIVSS